MSHPGDITRRTAVGALAAAGAGFALFGPRGAKENSAGRTVLDYWEKWTGHEGKAMQTVVDQFNASQSRIFVRYLVTAGIDQKALIAVAGGDPPDIVGLWNYNVPLYAETNAILPLDDLGAPHGLRIENYARGVRPIMQHPDRDGRVRLWATINTGGTVAMYYNKSIFREVGLDPQRPPRTISELDECCRRIEIVRPGGAIARAGFMHTEPGWWSWIWGYSFGGMLYDAATDKSLAASRENIAAFEWMQSYSKRLGPGPSRKFRSAFATEYSSARNALLDGKVAMVVQGPWLANVINRFKPDFEYGVAPFPVIESIYDEKSPVGLIDTDILVIPRGVKHPEASMEFIAYTQRQEIVEFLSTAHCKNSPLATASEAFLANHPNKGVRVHYDIARSPRGYLCPRTRTWPQFKDEFDASLQRMWGLERPASEELTRIEDRTQGFLDHAQQQRMRRGYGGRGVKGSTLKSDLAGWLWISPWVVGFLAFMLVPMAMSLYYSFTDYPLLEPPIWVGGENYTRMLHDDVFHKALWKTIVYGAVSIPISTGIALLVAGLLNARVRASGFFQAAVFVPTLVPMAASAMIWLWLLNGQEGLLNRALAALGVRGPNWLTDSDWAMPSIIMVSLWGVGQAVVVYLAAMREVPEQLYEAAAIDGMSPPRRFWSITLPMISPVILFNAVTLIIGTVQVFAVPYIITKATPGGDPRSMYFYTMYMYDNAFVYNKMGYASAQAWVQLLIVLGLTGAMFALSRRFVHYRGA